LWCVTRVASSNERARQWFCWGRRRWLAARPTMSCGVGMRVPAQPFRFGWLAWLCLFVQEPRRAIAAFLAAYAAATCFSPNVLAFDAFSERADSFLVPIAAIIRWLGSMTFALYLFHQPLLSLFTVYHVSDRSSSAQLVLLVGGTFPVVPLGRSCENTKGATNASL